MGMPQFGHRVRAFRKSRGLKQWEVARKVGVEQHTVSAWESGLHVPRLEVCQRLADAFGLDLQYLLFGPLPEPPADDGAATPDPAEAG